MTSLRRWPWPFLLLLVGAALGITGLIKGPQLSSSVVLIVFLPALLFDAGFSLQLGAVRKVWHWIALLGLAGSVLAAGIAFLLLSAFGFDRAQALLLCAVLAATDPVSVFAALRRVPTPPQLRLTLEGESLVNDGVAIVLTTLALAIVSSAGVHPAELIFLFLRLSLVGLVVGALLGLLGRPALRRLPRPADVLLTIGLAYAAYLLADRIGGSGLLAVIGVALVLATGYPQPTDNHVHRFWRGAGSVMAAVVFLLMGLQARAGALLNAAPRLLILVVVTFAARALMVLLVTRLAPRRWPWKWRAALTWAGLRGALSLALALSLPLRLAGRADLLVLVLGFILVSLALQGLSIKPVFRWLRVAGFPRPPG
ncbi:MAG: hypothetical protein PVSMB9_02830 [Candidatus Dormibacteria bacterium]